MHFPRDARIVRKQDYERLFSKGKKVVGKHFICYVAVETDQQTRLGLVTSRKVGRAVHRNRVKRLIREFFRRNRQRFPQGMQIVVVARVSSSSLTGNACARELEQMLGDWLVNG